LYSFSFMHSMGGRLLYAATLEAVFAVLTAAAVIFIWRGSPPRWRAPEVLTASVVCVVMMLVGPDTIGAGLFIHKRLVFCACIFLAAWLAGQNWPAVARNILPALFLGLSIILLAAKIPALALWNQRISSFMAMQDAIRPRSSILWLNLQQLEAGPDPYRDAAGMLAAKSIIDLRNYEATANLFLSRFRPEHMPFPALGTLGDIAGAPPKFDTASYERATHDRADYIVFQGPEAREMRMFPTQLADYLLISTSRDGGLRLYERKPGDLKSPPSPDK